MSNINRTNEKEHAMSRKIAGSAEPAVIAGEKSADVGRGSRHAVFFEFDEDGQPVGMGISKAALPATSISKLERMDRMILEAAKAELLWPKDNLLHDHAAWKKTLRKLILSELKIDIEVYN